jgi:hypothetical protein
MARKPTREAAPGSAFKGSLEYERPRLFGHKLGGATRTYPSSQFESLSHTPIRRARGYDFGRIAITAPPIEQVTPSERGDAPGRSSSKLETESATMPRFNLDGARRMREAADSDLPDLNTSPGARGHDFSRIAITASSSGGAADVPDQPANAVEQEPVPAPPAQAKQALQEPICNPVGPLPPSAQKPTGETTTFNGWDTGDFATAANWRQQLQPTSLNFSGCTVTEEDPGGGKDECWFKGSAKEPATLSGLHKFVHPGNFWGDDRVGWSVDAVKYYRDQGKAPCSFYIPQSMKIVRLSGNIEYYRDQLVGTIGTTTVGSSRAGAPLQSKPWP